MNELSIAIVGASVAGVRAAETLRLEGFDGSLVLIGDEPHLPYDRPPLSKTLLCGSQGPDDTLLRPPEFYDELNIELMLGRSVAGLRPSLRTLELEDGHRVHADRVLLATGGRARRLGVEGSDLKGVYVLRSMADALGLSAELQPGARVVVIGGGFIGAEVAASARVLGCSATILEVGPSILGRVLDRVICDRFCQEHVEKGVDVRTGVVVDHIAGSDRVRAVVLADGTEIRADVVVVGIGIQPNVHLAEMAGVEVADGVKVDEFCQTSNPAVFAAGDVASFWSPSLGRHVRREQWQHASDHAAAAARSMLGKGRPYDNQMWFWSDQYDLKLQMVGQPSPGDEAVWRGELSDTSFCVLYIRDGSLSAAVGVNRPKDLRGAMLAIEAGTKLTRDQLTDPTVDLRKLATSH